MGHVCNKDKLVNATSLLWPNFGKRYFDFLSSFVLTKAILDLTLPVTQLLQGPAIDIADATHLIESLKKLICFKRNTVDTFHKMCFSDILEISCRVGIAECKARTLEFQRIRINSDYLKKAVTIP